MRIHHLNLASICIRGGWLTGNIPDLITHSLLVETNDGLVLVDSGFGLKDVAAPRARLGELVHLFSKIELSEEQTAVGQLKRLGFRPTDVRHIIPTHLDFDHAGGLPDFPHARVHAHALEIDAALSPQSTVERERYHAHLFMHQPRWNRYEEDGERWFGFDSVRAPEGLPEEILLIPLFGHTRGHCGVAVKREDGKWWFHAGDAYFHHGELDVDRPRCPPGLVAFQEIMQIDRKARLENRRRLRELKASREGEIEIFCAHDAYELKEAQTKQSVEPLGTCC